MAAAIAAGIIWVLATYKQLLEIRRLRDEMKQEGVPDAKLGGVDEHADDMVAEGIDKAVEALIKDFGQILDETRQHEMRTALKLSLNAISNQVDRGYNIEVRAGPLLPEGESDDEEGEQAVEESRRTGSWGSGVPRCNSSTSAARRSSACQRSRMILSSSRSRARSQTGRSPSGTAPVETDANVEESEAAWPGR